MQMMHWNYFFAIEDDLATLSRYVEFHKDNFQTYSVETAKILMAAVQEVDVLFKAICNHYGAAVANIGDYCDLMTSKHPVIREAEVGLPHYSIVRRPFAEWSPTNPPPWWSANNKVKHARDTRFASASLENTIDAVSALLIVNFFRHGIIESPLLWGLPRPLRLLDAGWFSDGDGGPQSIIVYRVPGAEDLERRRRQRASSP
jgi:hypothetical protein